MKNKHKTDQTQNPLGGEGNQVRAEVPDNTLSMESLSYSYGLSAQLNRLTDTCCHDRKQGDVIDKAHASLQMSAICQKMSGNNHVINKGATIDKSIIRTHSLGYVDRSPFPQRFDGACLISKHGSVYGNSDGAYVIDVKNSKTDGISKTNSLMSNNSKSSKEDCNNQMKSSSCYCLMIPREGVQFSKLQKMGKHQLMKNQSMSTVAHNSEEEQTEKTENMKEDLMKDVTKELDDKQNSKKEDQIRDVTENFDNKQNQQLDDENIKYERAIGFLPIRRKSKADVSADVDMQDVLKPSGESRNTDHETEEVDNKVADEIANRSIKDCVDEETSCKSQLDPLNIDEEVEGSTLKVDLPEKKVKVDGLEQTREGEESEHCPSVTESSWTGEMKMISSRGDEIETLNSIDDVSGTTMNSMGDEGPTPDLADSSREGPTQDLADSSRDLLNLQCQMEKQCAQGKQPIVLAFGEMVMKICEKDDLLKRKAVTDEILSEKEKAMSQLSEKDEFVEEDVEKVHDQKSEVISDKLEDIGKDKHVDEISHDKIYKEKDVGGLFKTCTEDIDEILPEKFDQVKDLEVPLETCTKDTVYDKKRDSEENVMSCKSGEKVEYVKMSKELEKDNLMKEVDGDELEKNAKVVGGIEKLTFVSKENKSSVGTKKKTRKNSKKNKGNEYQSNGKTDVSKDVEGPIGCAKEMPVKGRRMSDQRSLLSGPNKPEDCDPAVSRSKTPNKRCHKLKSNMPKKRCHTPKSKKPKEKCHEPKSKTSDCDIYIPKGFGGMRQLTMLRMSKLRGRQCSDAGSNNSGSSNDGKNSQNGSGRKGSTRGDANNNHPNKGSDDSGNRGNPNDNDGSRGDGPPSPSNSASGKRSVSSISEEDIPERDYKKYRKKHSDISVEHWEKFLGFIKEQAEGKDGPCWDLKDNPVGECFILSMENMEDLSDDMLDCAVCTTINSLLKHYANCNSAYVACDVCTQIFSLITCHVNVCAGKTVFGTRMNNCNVTLCKKIGMTLTGSNIRDHLKMLWFNIRKKLSRVIGDVDTGTISERKSSIVSIQPSLGIIPEGEVSEVAPKSRTGSRILSRKRSNLISVDERPEEAAVSTPVHGEIGPNISAGMDDNSVDALPLPNARKEERERFNSLPMGPPKGHEYQFPSFTDRPIGVKGIGEVVYGDKSQLVLVVQYWDKLKKDYTESGKLLTHYREEGVILNKYKDKLTIGTMRYQEDFQWVRVTSLGNGMSGKCSLATDFQTDAKFCVKEIHISSFEMDEVALMTDLDHPHIVQLYGAIRFGEKVFIFMEYIAGGCLTEAINQQKVLGQRLSQTTALRYCQQLLQVLCYLKSKHILHEDLKGDNILQHTDGTNVSIKVTDFGSARRCRGQVRKGTPPIGTQTQWSPEKAEATGYSFPAEVWAVVCVLVHMLSGTPPWVRRFGTFKTLIVVIVDNSPPLEDIPRNISKSIIDLMERGFTVCPGMRPTAEDLLLHQAFSILDNSPSEVNYSILGPSFHSVACIEDDISKDLREIKRNLEKNSSGVRPINQTYQVFTITNQAAAQGGPNNAMGGVEGPGGGSNIIMGGVNNPVGGAISLVGGSINDQGGVTRPEGGAGNQQGVNNNNGMGGVEGPGGGSNIIMGGVNNPVGGAISLVGGSINDQGGVTRPEGGAGNQQGVNNNNGMGANNQFGAEGSVQTQQEKKGGAKEKDRGMFSPSNPVKNADATLHFQNYLSDLDPPRFPEPTAYPLVEYHPDLTINESSLHESKSSTLGSEDALQNVLPNFELLGLPNTGEESSREDEYDNEEDPFKSFDLANALRDMNLGQKENTDPVIPEGDVDKGLANPGLSSSVASSLQTRPTYSEHHESTNESINDDDLFKSGSPTNSRMFHFNPNTSERQAIANPSNLPLGVPDQHNLVTQNLGLESAHDGHAIQPQNFQHGHGRPSLGHSGSHEGQVPHVGHWSLQHGYHGDPYGYQNPQVGHHHLQYGHHRPSHKETGFNYGHNRLQSDQHGPTESPYGQTFTTNPIKGPAPRPNHGHGGSNYGPHLSHSEHGANLGYHGRVPITNTGAGVMGPPTVNPGFVSLQPQVGLHQAGRGEPPLSLNPNLLVPQQNTRLGSQTQGNQFEHHVRPEGFLHQYGSGSPDSQPHSQQNVQHYRHNEPHLHRDQQHEQRPAYQQPHSFAGYHQAPGQFGVGSSITPRSYADQLPRTGAPLNGSSINPHRTMERHVPGGQHMPRISAPSTAPTMMNPQDNRGAYFPAWQHLPRASIASTAPSAMNAPVTMEGYHFPDRQHVQMTHVPSRAPSMGNPQVTMEGYFPAGYQMQYHPNDGNQFVPQEMTSPQNKQATKQANLQLDVEKAKHGPVAFPVTCAQTAPVISPPKTPKLMSPPLNRTVSYVQPRSTNRLRLSGSSTSAGSRSLTPFEEQEKAYLEFGTTAIEALSQHDGSIIGLEEEDEDQAFEDPATIDLEGDLTPNEWESMAPYLDEDELGTPAPSRIEVTFKRRGDDEDVLKMSFPRKNWKLSWETIIEDELSRHKISSVLDRFCLRLEDSSLIDLDSCLGEENVVAYVEPADDRDWWWVEKGVIMKSSRRR